MCSISYYVRIDSKYEYGIRFWQNVEKKTENIPEKIPWNVFVTI